MSFVKYLSAKWVSFSKSEKCYLLAMAFVLCRGYYLSNPSIDLKFPEYLSFIFGFLFSASGFYLWFKPKIQSLKEDILANLIFNFFRACFAICAIWVSRKYISEAMQLPVSDYDLTVAALAVFVGFFLWVYTFVIVLMELAFIYSIVGGAFSLIGTHLTLLIPVLSLFVDKSKIEKTSELVKKKADKRMIQTIGIVILAVSALEIF